MDLISIGEPPSIGIPEPSGFVVGRNEGCVLCPPKHSRVFSLRPHAHSTPPAAAGTAVHMGTDVFSPFLHNNSYISVLALLPAFEN